MKRIQIVALVLLVLLAGCGNTKELNNRTVRDVNLSAEEKPQTTVVKRQDIVDSYNYEGQVFYKTFQLSFPQEGTFDIFKVGPGDEVKEGQIIATTQGQVSEKEYNRLKDTADNIKKNYQYDLAIKKLELERLETELEMIYEELEKLTGREPNYLQVCRRAGIKFREIEHKKLEIKQLKETYETEYPYYSKQVSDYKKSMDKNVIKAPCDGIAVALYNVQRGAYVDSESFYAAVADTSTLYVYTDYMTEKFIESYSEIYALINGKKYELEYIPMEKGLYQRLLTNDVPMYSTFAIKDIDENVSADDVALISIVRMHAENVLVVPHNALSGDSAGRFVYVEGKDGREKRYVILGNTDGAYFEIRSGLEEGEVIYIGN